MYTYVHTERARLKADYTRTFTVVAHDPTSRETIKAGRLRGIPNSRSVFDTFGT